MHIDYPVQVPAPALGQGASQCEAHGETDLRWGQKGQSIAYTSTGRKKICTLEEPACSGSSSCY